MRIWNFGNISCKYEDLPGLLIVLINFSNPDSDRYYLALALSQRISIPKFEDLF